MMYSLRVRCEGGPPFVHFGSLSLHRDRWQSLERLVDILSREMYFTCQWVPEIVTEIGQCVCGPLHAVASKLIHSFRVGFVDN